MHIENPEALRTQNNGNVLTLDHLPGKAPAKDSLFGVLGNIANVPDIANILRASIDTATLTDNQNPSTLSRLLTEIKETNQILTKANINSQIKETCNLTIAKCIDALEKEIVENPKQCFDGIMDLLTPDQLDRLHDGLWRNDDMRKFIIQRVWDGSKISEDKEVIKVAKQYGWQPLRLKELISSELIDLLQDEHFLTGETSHEIAKRLNINLRKIAKRKINTLSKWMIQNYLTDSLDEVLKRTGLPEEHREELEVCLLKKLHDEFHTNERSAYENLKEVGNIPIITQTGKSELERLETALIRKALNSDTSVPCYAVTGNHGKKYFAYQLASFKDMVARLAPLENITIKTQEAINLLEEEEEILVERLRKEFVNFDTKPETLKLALMKFKLHTEHGKKELKEALIEYDSKLIYITLEEVGYSDSPLPDKLATLHHLPLQTEEGKTLLEEKLPKTEEILLTNQIEKIINSNLSPDAQLKSLDIIQNIPLKTEHAKNYRQKVYVETRITLEQRLVEQLIKDVVVSQLACKEKLTQLQNLYNYPLTTESGKKKLKTALEQAEEKVEYLIKAESIARILSGDELYEGDFDVLQTKDGNQILAEKLKKLGDKNRNYATADQYYETIKGKIHRNEQFNCKSLAEELGLSTTSEVFMGLQMLVINLLVENFIERNEPVNCKALAEQYGLDTTGEVFKAMQLLVMKPLMPRLIARGEAIDYEKLTKQYGLDNSRTIRSRVISLQVQQHLSRGETFNFKELAQNNEIKSTDPCYSNLQKSIVEKIVPQKLSQGIPFNCQDLADQYGLEHYGKAYNELELAAANILVTIITEQGKPDNCKELAEQYGIRKAGAAYDKLQNAVLDLLILQIQGEGKPRNCKALAEQYGLDTYGLNYDVLHQVVVKVLQPKLIEIINSSEANTLSEQINFKKIAEQYGLNKSNTSVKQLQLTLIDHLVPKAFEISNSLDCFDFCQKYGFDNWGPAFERLQLAVEKSQRNGE